MYYSPSDGSGPSTRSAVSASNRVALSPIKHEARASSPDWPPPYDGGEITDASEDEPTVPVKGKGKGKANVKAEPTTPTKSAVRR